MPSVPSFTLEAVMSLPCLQLALYAAFRVTVAVANNGGTVGKILCSNFSAPHELGGPPRKGKS